jgi:pimeloyl-ACP methyl ester carboxylesterase
MCAAITRILNTHGLHRVVIVGHSYGTVVAAHLLRWQQEQNGPTRHTTGAGYDGLPGGDSDLGDMDIAAALLIDPIPFLLHHPAIAYNFVYRQPRCANEWQLWYFASRDPDIARALSRHFFWFENILFREDVIRVAPVGDEDESQKSNPPPPPVAVSLAGRDQIVDTRAVHAYLTSGVVKDAAEVVPPARWAEDGLEVHYFPELDHATVFDARKNRAPLLEILSRFVRVRGDESLQDL